MKILNEYPGSHHYIEEYEETSYFCPECGLKGVWSEASGGDYYVGGKWICTMGGHEFYLPNGVWDIKDENELGIVKQLREGKTYEPTTKKGG